MYVWEHPFFPQYYLPLSAVADGVLTPIAEREGRGLRYDVLGGGRVASGAAVSFPDHPIPELRDHVRFEFGAMDAWFEEDEEIIVHPRDPATRVQTLPSSRRVTVSVDGVVIADTGRPTFLHETGLPRRTYLPKLDVRLDLLTPTTTSSRCPYKGTARVLVGHDPGRGACRPGVELPDPAARIDGDRRADRLLRRARRRHGRRRRPAPTGDQVQLMSDHVLVIGGTGPTGIPIVRGLVERGHGSRSCTAARTSGTRPRRRSCTSTPIRTTPTHWPQRSTGAATTSSSRCTAGCDASPS